MVDRNVRAVQRIGHPHGPSRFSWRRANGIDTAGAGIDERRRHACIAQHSGNTVERIALADASQVKLDAASEKKCRADALVEFYTLPACLRARARQFFI